MGLEILYFSLSFIFMMGSLSLFSFCYTRTYIWPRDAATTAHQDSTVADNDAHHSHLRVTSVDQAMGPLQRPPTARSLDLSITPVNV
eukprot:m.134492 g.134492  ORF g.134492 m.134492 type:complete len:87 (+) comp15974_c0_seq5:184-444(+)